MVLQYGKIGIYIYIQIKYNRIDVLGDSKLLAVSPCLTPMFKLMESDLMPL